MTIYLRQATASQEVPLGFFLDSTDGDTAETGLTIANTDIKLWKTGATTLVDKNSGGATHISGGIFYTVLDATDTDTIGPMVIFVHVSGALSVRLECVVLDEAVYDSMFGTTALSTYAGGDTSGVTTLLSRLTSTRAGYLDNLSAGVIPTAAQIATAVLDAAYEGTEKVKEGLRLIRSAVAGILSGAATTTITTRDIANSKNRISATVDADGNRSAVTVDVS